MGADCPSEQLALAPKRDIVGALRRRQRCNDDADDGDCDDNAERHQHTEACTVPAGWLGKLSRSTQTRGGNPWHSFLHELLAGITGAYVSIIAIGLQISAALQT